MHKKFLVRSFPNIIYTQVHYVHIMYTKVRYGSVRFGKQKSEVQFGSDSAKNSWFGRFLIHRYIIYTGTLYTQVHYIHRYNVYTGTLYTQV